MSELESHDQHQVQNGRARSLIPPHHVVRNFLPPHTVTSLIDYTVANRSRFFPTRVGSREASTVEPEMRRSLGMTDLGEFTPIFETEVLGRVPGLIKQLQVTPFEAAKLEVELVAHGDGAFFKPHVDMAWRTKRIRVLSGVYYFHIEPKGFTGGCLRLHALGGPPGESFVDIEPIHNSLLVFPSWARHEVLPVQCPSKQFSDSRFSVNCWVRQRKPNATSLPA